MEDNKCPVCYESDKPLQLMSANCSHMFCITCVMKMTKLKACPYCRTVIKAINENGYHCSHCLNVITNIKSLNNEDHCLSCIKEYLKHCCKRFYFSYNYDFSCYIRIDDFLYGSTIKNVTFNEIKDITTNISHLNKMYYNLNGYYESKTNYLTAMGIVKYLITDLNTELNEIIIKGKNRLQKEYEQELKYKQYFSKYVLPYVLNDEQSMYKDFYSTYVMNQMKYVNKYGIYLNTHSDTEE